MEKSRPSITFCLFLSTSCDIIIGVMENKPKFHPNQKNKLMGQVREVLRYHHYAYRTETTYCQWILRYIHHYGGKTHPQNLGSRDVERFLSHLATKENLSVAAKGERTGQPCCPEIFVKN